AATQRVEAAGQLLASDEGEHGVDSVGREGARGGDDVVPLTVDRLVGAEASCEGDAVASGRRGQHTRAAQFGELQCEHADVAACAVNDHALTVLDLERVVDAL